MAYQLGDDQDPIAIVQAQQATLLAEFRRAERARKMATIYAIAGAVFAAFRLGILAIPHLKRRRAMGSLAAQAAPAAIEPAKSPRRR